MKRLARIVIPTMAGILLLASGGCGGGRPNLDPAEGEAKKQARISALGPTGQADVRGATGSGGSSPGYGGGAQAAARAKAARGN